MTTNNAKVEAVQAQMEDVNHKLDKLVASLVK
jgi:hypothetical protein